MKNFFISHFRQFSSESVDSLELNMDLSWDTDNFDKVSLLKKQINQIHGVIKERVM